MAERVRPAKALILSASGINRDIDTKNAYEVAGGQADIIHVNQLKSGEKKLGDYQVFHIPGGFSCGDHIQSGRVLALEFQNNNLLSDQICEHLRKGKIILGVCNGFQMLVQAGLLPFGEIHSLQENVATLASNKPPGFISKWVQLKSFESKCLFVDPNNISTLPIAHGEGKFLTKDEMTLQKLVCEKQIVYRYERENPNGSVMGIAGICDPSGQILGMMPHAEDFVRRENHPNWRRLPKDMSVDGLKFFQNIVRYVKEL